MMNLELAIVLKYLGITYVPGGRDITGMDCFGLCIAAYLEFLKVQIRIDTGDCLNSGYWERIPSPESLCIVRMGDASGNCHVGLYLESNHGAVLHCVPGRGVVVSPIDSLQDMQLRVTSFFRLRL
jgi:hypothetical protein